MMIWVETPSKSVSISVAQETWPKDDAYCALCEMLVAAADTFLQDNNTDAAINATALHFCNNLPDTVKPVVCNFTAYC